MGTKQRKMMAFMMMFNMALAVTAITVSAEEMVEERKKNSLQLKAGLFAPTGEADDSGYETGGDVTLAYNRYLSDVLVLEGALAFFGTGVDSDGSGGTAGSFSQDNYLGTTALLLTLKREYPVGPVDLYGGAGVGLYAVYLESEIDTKNLGSFDLDDNDSVFGVHLVAGANYNLNERFFVGLEGSYRWTGDVELSDSRNNIPTHFEGDLSGFTVSLAAGFRF